MRIVSQDGMIDLPYESIGVSINHNDNCVIIAYPAGIFTPSDEYWEMARYSTEEKARKSMELLQDSYVANKLFKTIDKEQKALCISINNIEEQKIYGVFRFPDDKEI